jgi:hypothetical protein
MFVSEGERVHGESTPWKATTPWAKVRTQKKCRGFPKPSAQKERNTHMLMTIAIVLLLLYALGLVTSYTMGGLIHILLVVALVVVLVRIIQGRRLM